MFCNHVIRLKGEVVSLCPIRTDDFAIRQYLRWISDEEINYWICTGNSVYNFDMEKEFLKRVSVLDSNNIYFNIVLNDSYSVIGNCDISYLPHNRRTSLGIMIGDKDSLGKGYGTEAVKLMIAFSFDNLNAHSVCLQTMADNARAISCYKKAGFKVSGIDHDAVYIGGKYHDLVHMEIIKGECEYKID